MNDQLVEVNGVSLLGMDNSRAIQVLREAMMKDGRIHGFIGITVLRPRAAKSTGQAASPCREVRVSQADNDDVADGVVSVLPRPRPVDIHNVADSPSVASPSDIAQVTCCYCLVNTYRVKYLLFSHHI